MLKRNLALDEGGAVYASSDSSIQIQLGEMDENQANTRGSAVYLRGSHTTTAEFKNMFITEQSSDGTSDYVLRLYKNAGERRGPRLTLRNVTLAGNTQIGSGLIGLTEDSYLSSYASIISHNEAGPYVVGTGDANIHCSILDTAFIGSNDVADPLFIDPDNGNYHISANSPAKNLCDSGDNWDADGQTRPLSKALANIKASHQKSELNKSEIVAAFTLRAPLVDQVDLDALSQIALRIKNYQSYYWFELDANNVSAFSQQCPVCSRVDHFGQIHNQPLSRTPALEDIPAGSSTPLVNTQGKALFQVQLFSPARQQDLTLLQTLGEPLVYQPFYSYLIWSDTANMNKLDHDPDVLWWDAWTVEQKLSSAIDPLPENYNQYQLHVMPDGTGNLSLSNLIDAQGGTIKHIEPAADISPIIKTENWIIEYPKLDLQVLATEASVIMLSPYYFSDIEDERSTMIVANQRDANDDSTLTGYDNWLNNTGYSGSGVTVAIVDTGIDWDHPDLNVVSGTEIGGYAEADEPGSDGCPDSNGDNRNGCGHGTHVAGIVAGTGASGTTDGDDFEFGTGVAPDAGLHATDAIAEDSGGTTLLQRALDSASNADLSNNSWRFVSAGQPLFGAGYSQDAANLDLYALDSQEGDGTNYAPFLSVFSAGNSGDDCAGPCMSSITPPKEAKNILVVGNSTIERSDTAGGTAGPVDDISISSSRGPALDGRILPHLVAPGTNIVSSENRNVDLGGATGWACSTSPAGSNQHAYCSGTSMASPHVAGAAALFTEFWRVHKGTTSNPRPETVKAALLVTTDNLEGQDDGWGNNLGHRPDNHQGWGRINIDRLLNPTVPVQIFQSPTTFTETGQDWTITVEPYTTDEPLRITLVWADAPGAANANPALVNDLDLYVSNILTLGSITFGGDYWGNQFTDGWSDASIDAQDNRDNIENVWIETPSILSSYHRITVSASQIAGDGVIANADATDQSFSLVCYNCKTVEFGEYDAGADEIVGRVGINGGACIYPFISDAIANSANDDEIYISPGLYEERMGDIESKNLSFFAALPDCSGSDPQATSDTVIVDASGLPEANNGGVLRVRSGNVSIRNMTLQNGTALRGGNLHADTGSVVLAHNVVLRGGHANSVGGGLRIYSGEVILTGNSIIENNTADSNGGGIAISQNGILSSYTNELKLNQSQTQGSAIHCDGGGEVTLGNDLVHNQSGSSAIFINGCSVDIDQTVIADNAGRGMDIYSPTSFDIDNSIIWGNELDSGTSGFTAQTGCNLDQSGLWGPVDDPIFLINNYELASNSPGIDACSTGLPSDHNFVNRPIDGGGPDGAFYDIGAYERSGIIRYTLDLNIPGDGSVRVVSTPSGIDCSDDCSYGFPSGTVLTLEAQDIPATSTLLGWGGHCSGTAPSCQLTMDQDRTVTINVDDADIMFKDSFED